MSYTYANNVRAALGAAVGVGDVTLTIAAAVAPFNPPAAASVSVPARLTIVDSLYAPTKIEIVTYTGRTGSGPYTLTGVTRAQESTTAQAFVTGYVYQSATAADYSAFSALTDLTPIGVLGTGSDTAFDSTDSMVITHSTLSSASRFKRVGAVYEYTAGSSATDSTMDFDYADILNYTRDVETPNATITPSATTNTYQNKTLGSAATTTRSVGRRTLATQGYSCAYQFFKGPCAMTGFQVTLGANALSPAGDIGWKLIKTSYGNKYTHHQHEQVIASGQFTPTPSAANTITFSSTAYLDDSFYKIVLYAIEDQGVDNTYYTVDEHTTSVANSFGSYELYASTYNQIDFAPKILNGITTQLRMVLTAGTVNAGVTLTISGDYWYPTDIGKTVRGNSGHFLITGLTDLCTGGTALSGAGTAANAFDNDLVGTSCAASTNGYVGYDFGSSKTIRGVSVMFADGTYDRTLDLIIEVSDDNFTGSTTVLNPSARSYQNRCQYYWDITSPTAGRYIRIRETGGAALTVMEMECYDGTTALAHLHLTAFADTSAITSGNWTLEGTGWNNGWASGEVSSGLIAPVSTSGFASIDAIASALTYGGPQVVNRATLSTNSLTTSWNALARGRKLCHLENDVYAIVYSANSATDAYVIIAEVASDGSITYGAPSAFLLGGTFYSNACDIVTLSSSLFVVAHADKLYACSVSGTTITVGVAVTNTATTDVDEVRALVKVDTTKFLVVGSLVTSNYCAVVAGSVSGTTITLGSKLDLNAAVTYFNTASLIDTDKVVVAYVQNTSTTTLRGKVVSLSGTTCSAGAEATVSISGEYTLSGHSSLRLTTNKILVGCGNSAGGLASNQAVAGTVSGTTLTWGTPVSIIKPAGFNACVIPSTATMAYMADRFAIVPLYISGTTITTGQLQPTIGGRFYPMHGAAGSKFFAVARDSYIADDRLCVETMKLTAQGILQVGPVVSVSFNGTTYSVWNGSAARNIASSLNSVHGGTDGTWYYRDSASVWTAESTNSALGALKQAQSYSANCMSVDEMKQMSSANWTTLGFVEAGATTYFGFTWASDNTRYLMPFDLDKLSLTYTSRARWDQNQKDYVINMGAETGATITKSTAGTASIKAVIMGPSS